MRSWIHVPPPPTSYAQCDRARRRDKGRGLVGVRSTRLPWKQEGTRALFRSKLLILAVGVFGHQKRGGGEGEGGAGRRRDRARGGAASRKAGEKLCIRGGVVVQRTPDGTAGSLGGIHLVLRIWDAVAEDGPESEPSYEPPDGTAICSRQYSKICGDNNPERPKFGSRAGRLEIRRGRG